MTNTRPTPHPSFLLPPPHPILHPPPSTITRRPPRHPQARRPPTSRLPNKSDEAFATCPTCGADELLSASRLLSRGSLPVQCSQCGARWTALLADAMTSTGGKLEAGRPSQRGTEQQATSTDVTLFVGGLAPKVDDATLRKVLEEFGDVRSARVLYDRVTGRSRGFGFVTMGRAAARAAVDVLSGDSSTVLGRGLKVREARGD